MASDFNPFSLIGKRILVTGASSGIGRAIAIQCSRMGAEIVLTARNRQALQATLNAMEGEGHLVFPADLTDKKDIDGLVDSLPELDGVANCAGICRRTLCKSLNEEDIEGIMSINFNAAVLLQKALLSCRKLKKGASIVFLSSRTAEIPTAANSVYSASKAALKAYSKCLSLELAPKGIRVNSICPAMVWTDLILDNGEDIEQLRESEKRYPLKRYGQPEDIANLAVYLLSDASSWMTGSSIDITGGAVEI